MSCTEVTLVWAALWMLSSVQLRNTDCRYYFLGMVFSRDLTYLKRRWFLCCTIKCYAWNSRLGVSLAHLTAVFTLWSRGCLLPETALCFISEMYPFFCWISFAKDIPRVNREELEQHKRRAELGKIASLSRLSITDTEQEVEKLRGVLDDIAANEVTIFSGANS